MKIFRTKFIIPTVLIIAVICVFFIFYFDTYLKKLFISSGELIFGAKVEIGNVTTKFKNLSVDIADIKIGDKENEYKNLADIESIKFGVRFIPLLSKKVIIDNMSMEGIRWGTSRADSAKLPPKKKKKTEKAKEPSFAEKAMHEFKEKASDEFNSFPGVRKFEEIRSQIKNFTPQSIVDMAGIQSVSRVQDFYVDLMGRYDSYNKTVNSIDIKGPATEVSNLIDEISKTRIESAADVSALKNRLSALDEQRKILEQTYKDLNEVKKSITNDINSQKNAFKDINKLINEDVENISSKLSIPSLDFRNAGRMLFGDVWIKRADTVLHYMSLVRKYMPEKKEEAQPKPEPKERMKGTEVVYRLNSVLPKLLISNVFISGTSGGEGKEVTPISFTGNIRNITSDQRITGKITTFEVKGDDTNQIITVTGSFDRLKDTAEDIIAFSMENVDAVRLGIPDTDYTPSFKDAKAGFKTGFTLRGSDFITDAGFSINGLYYDVEAKNFTGIDKNITKYVNMLWQGIHAVNADAKLSILTEEGLRAEFSSDIDKLLGQRFNNILNASIGDVKQKIKTEVTQYVNTQKDVLQKEADKYRQQIQKELEPKIKEIQTKINEIKQTASRRETDLKKQSITSLIPKPKSN